MHTSAIALAIVGSRLLVARCESRRWQDGVKTRNTVEHEWPMV